MLGAGIQVQRPPPDNRRTLRARPGVFGRVAAGLEALANRAGRSRSAVTSRQFTPAASGSRSRWRQALRMCVTASSAISVAGVQLLEPQLDLLLLRRRGHQLLLDLKGGGGSLGARRG